jgi:hypothetical protein
MATIMRRMLAERNRLHRENEKLRLERDMLLRIAKIKLEHGKDGDPTRRQERPLDHQMLNKGGDYV